MVLNTQSIKKKEDILAEYLKTEAIDIVIVMETWFTNQDRDVIWSESNKFVKDGYLINAVNRDRRRVGGIARIYKSNITVSKINQITYSSFEVAHWMMSIENTTLNLLGIYHPPYSTSQKITNLMFLDELTDHLTKWMSSFRNILIEGNFNIHIDDTEDPDDQIFKNTIEALGLQQHVTFPTHRAGNTLDLIFTEITSKLDLKIFKDSYISNHRAIVAELPIRVQHNIGTTVTFRNLKK